VLEIVNVFFFFVGASLVATGIYTNSSLSNIPGPARDTTYGIIAIGAVTMIISCIGLSGAQKRKREGSEKCGLMLLLIYTVIMAVIIIAVFTISVVVFVWLGNELPVENAKVDEGSVEADAYMENFLKCTFDSCCHFKLELNVSSFYPVKCKLDPEEHYPTHEGEEYFSNGKVPDIANPEKMTGLCNMAVLTVERCMRNGTKSYDDFRADVRQELQETVNPIATALLIVACFMLLGWVLAIVEILWCCGKSDEVQPEYDEDDKMYDDY
jgi:hypothetical protein